MDKEIEQKIEKYLIEKKQAKVLEIINGQKEDIISEIYKFLKNDLSDLSIKKQILRIEDKFKEIKELQEYYKGIK